MGAVAARCSDVSLSKGPNAPKPLEASSSEEEDDEKDEEEEEDEEDDEDEDERKAEAENAINEGINGLKRGKTGTFKEVIDHATAVGIAEDKIAKAEKALEAHKANRRREAYEADLRAFMESPDFEVAAECEKMEEQGVKFGVSDKVLTPLREHLLELQSQRDLTPDEVAQAKLFLEDRTRRFAKSAVVGRPTIWVAPDSGKKVRATLSVDLILRSLTVAKTAGEGAPLGSCLLVEAAPKRASEAEQVAGSEPFASLSEAERELAVAVLGPDPPWLFLEEDGQKVDEVMIGLTVLGGEASASSGSGGGGRGGAKKAKKKEAPGKARVLGRSGSMLEAIEEQHEAAPEVEISPPPPPPMDTEPPEVSPPPEPPPEDGGESHDGEAEASGGEALGGGVALADEEEERGAKVKKEGKDKKEKKEKKKKEKKGDDEET